jgi:hypothetical protein
VTAWFSRGSPRPEAADVAVRALLLKHVVVYSMIAPPRDTLAPMMSGWSAAERVQFAFPPEEPSAFARRAWLLPAQALDHAPLTRSA